MYNSGRRSMQGGEESEGVIVEEDTFHSRKFDGIYSDCNGNMDISKEFLDLMSRMKILRRRSR